MSRLGHAILRVLAKNKDRYGTNPLQSLFVDLAPKDGMLIRNIGERAMSFGFTQDEEVARSYKLDRHQRKSNKSSMYYVPSMLGLIPLTSGCDVMFTDISVGEANILACIKYFWQDPCCGQLFAKNVPADSSVVSVARSFNMSLRCVGVLTTTGCPDRVSVFQRADNRHKKKKTLPVKVDPYGKRTPCIIDRHSCVNSKPRQAVPTKNRIITGPAYKLDDQSQVLLLGRHVWEVDDRLVWEQNQIPADCSETADNILDLVKSNPDFLSNFNNKYAPAAIGLYHLLMQHGDGIQPADPCEIYPQARIGTELFTNLNGLVKLGAYIFRIPALFLLPSLADFARYGQILIDEADVLISLLYDKHLDFSSKWLFPPWYLKLLPPFTDLHAHLKTSIEVAIEALAYCRTSGFGKESYRIWRSGGKPLGTQMYIFGPLSVDIHDPDGCRIQKPDLQYEASAARVALGDPQFTKWQDPNSAKKLIDVILALGACGRFQPTDAAEFRARRGNAPEWCPTTTDPVSHDMWYTSLKFYQQLMTPTWNRFLVGFVEGLYASRQDRPERAYTMFSTVDWTTEPPLYESVDFNMAQAGYYFDCNIPVPRPRLVSDIFQTCLNTPRQYSDEQLRIYHSNNTHNNNYWSDAKIASFIRSFSWRCGLSLRGTCPLLNRRLNPTSATHETSRLDTSRT